MGKGKWMPFAEAVARAGSLKAVVVRLREGYPVARCAGFLLDGSPSGRGRKFSPDEWNDAHDFDPVAGRAVFLLNAGMEGVNFDHVAIGIEIKSADVDALWPLVAPEPASTPEPVKSKRPLPDWLETVASHFDETVGRKGPYPSQGSIREAIKIVLKDKGKTPPEDRTIERGLKKHRPNWFINKGT